MGTSASAHRTVVKSISIDQNGWSRSCPNDRAASASSRRSLPLLSNWIGKKSCEGSLTRNERVRLVDRAMRAESAALECEGKMKGLEREIRTLELRNHDLSTEVCWLRQQCTISCPDVPNGSMTSFVPPTCPEQCQVEKKVLQDTVTKQNAELSHLRMEVERLNAADVRKDIRTSELIKEITSARARIHALEDLCRNQMNGILPPSRDSIEETEEETASQEDQEAGGEANADQCEVVEELPPEDHGKLYKATKNSNLRILTSRPRPSLRKIFTTSKDRRIDGKVRPSTAIEARSSFFVPPPLERVDTAPVLKSVEILPGIPQNDGHAEVRTVEVHSDNPYQEDKDVLQDSESDYSDIDVTDILENSNRSTALSLRTQSSKSRDSGYCRADSFSAKHASNKQIV